MRSIFLLFISFFVTFLPAQSMRFDEAVYSLSENSKLLRPFIDLKFKQISVASTQNKKYYLTGIMNEKSDSIPVFSSEDQKVWTFEGMVLGCQNLSSVSIHYHNQTLFLLCSKADGGIYLLSNNEDKNRFRSVFHQIKNRLFTFFKIKSKKKLVFSKRINLSETGTDASLFFDKSTCYLICNGGDLYEVNDSYNAISEKIFRLPFFSESDTENSGQLSLLKRNDSYIAAFVKFNNRFNTNTVDLMVSTSKTLKSGWSKPQLALPHAGCASLFLSDKQQLFSVFCPHKHDNLAVFREQAATVRLSAKQNNLFVPAANLILEQGNVASTLPLSITDALLDPSITVGGDGNYYLTGTPNGFGAKYLENGVNLWKSTDLKSWESLGIIYNWGDLNFSKIDKNATLWTPSFFYIRKTNQYILSFSVYCNAQVYSFLFKSSSNLPTGPYQNCVDSFLVKGNDGFVFEDEDGSLQYIFDGAVIAPLKDDFSGFTHSPRLLKTYYSTVPAIQNGSLIKIDGKYLLTSGKWSGSSPENSTFDLAISVSDLIYGPYTPAIVTIPHAGNGVVFKDKNQQLKILFSGQDKSAPTIMKPTIFEIGRNKKGEIVYFD